MFILRRSFDVSSPRHYFRITESEVYIGLTVRTYQVLLFICDLSSVIPLTVDVTVFASVSQVKKE